MQAFSKRFAANDIRQLETNTNYLEMWVKMRHEAWGTVGKHWSKVSYKKLFDFAEMLFYSNLESTQSEMIAALARWLLLWKYKWG